MLEYPDGKVYTGTWFEDKKSGSGETHWPSGSVYVGEYEADKRHGQGEFIDEDGKKQTGDWFDDEFVGKSKARTYQQSQIREKNDMAFEKQNDKYSLP